MAKNTLKLADADKQMDQWSEIQSLQASLLSAAYDAIGKSDIQEIVKARVKAAKEGDKAALDFVFKYLLGQDGGNITFQTNNIITGVESAARIASNARSA